ncbi:MAG TPA: hypothetical protein VMJ35_01795 [Dongiaceae bacterium]|nr:hypothetical protein [Dongiaceae bacterium]
MRTLARFLVVLLTLHVAATLSLAQTKPGAIDITAHITPTGARPEPVRQFTIYVLTRSYADVVKEVSSSDPLPAREQFIDNLKCSKELKKWLKDHEVMDLTSPDLDKVITTDDIMNIPEFFEAYQRSNAGGVTAGIPKPKYHESDKESNPDKYQKQKDEFMSATRKFIDTHPFTVQGMELELTGVNPKLAWDRIQSDHRHKVAQLAPDTAQVKYLAGKAETDLDGRALITNLGAGNYWITSLGMDATSGDRRLLWDVAVSVLSGQTVHIELNNLNGTDARAATAP